MGERNQIIAGMENILSHSKNIQNLKNSNQVSLFGAEELTLPEIKLLPTEPASQKQRLNWEKELLGLYISDHPAREYQGYFQKMAVPIREINKDTVGKNISVGGVISKIQKIYLKNQKTMLFVTIEDMDSHMEILVFPKTLEATSSSWMEEKVILASGKISDKDGNFKLLCDSVKVITPEEVAQFERISHTQNLNGGQKKSEPAVEKLIIALPADSNQETIKKISTFCDHCERGPLEVHLSSNNSRLKTPYCIKKSDDLIASLQQTVPECQIKIV
jgi:DNA polymerase-3 subunit alpha